MRNREYASPSIALTPFHFYFQLLAAEIHAKFFVIFQLFRRNLHYACFFVVEGICTVSGIRLKTDCLEEQDHDDRENYDSKHNNIFFDLIHHFINLLL